MDHDIYNVQDYGAVGDGVADDTVAIRDTIEDAEETGGWVVFPTRVGGSIHGSRHTSYRLTDTLHVRRCIRIGSMLANGANEVALRWATPGCDGIVFDKATDAYAEGSIMENLSLVGANPNAQREWTDAEQDSAMATTTGKGVVIKAPRVTVRNCRIGYWALDGVHIYTADLTENANHARIEDCVHFNCGRHGSFAAGINSNHCLFLRCTGTGKFGGHSFYERSFLGNRYLHCLSEGARVPGQSYGWGYYTTPNTVAQNLLEGCYQEASDGPSTLRGCTIVIGGTWAGGAYRVTRPGEPPASPPIFIGVPAVGPCAIYGGYLMSPSMPPQAVVVRDPALPFTSTQVFPVSTLATTYLFDCTAGYLQPILPDPTTLMRQRFELKRCDGNTGSICWVRTLGYKPIEGANPQQVLALQPGQGVILQSDGVKYWTVARC